MFRVIRSLQSIVGLCVVSIGLLSGGAASAATVDLTQNIYNPGLLYSGPYDYTGYQGFGITNPVAQVRPDLWPTSFGGVAEIGSGSLVNAPNLGQNMVLAFAGGSITQQLLDFANSASLRLQAGTTYSISYLVGRPNSGFGANSDAQDINMSVFVGETNTTFGITASTSSLANGAFALYTLSFTPTASQTNMSNCDAGTFICGSLATLTLGAGNAATGGDVIFAAPVPLPAAVWMLGSGLFGLLGAGRRRRAAR